MHELAYAIYRRKYSLYYSTLNLIFTRKKKKKKFNKKKKKILFNISCLTFMRRYVKKNSQTLFKIIRNNNCRVKEDDVLLYNLSLLT